MEKKVENINEPQRVVEKETIIKEVPTERIVEKTIEVEKVVEKEVRPKVSFEGKPNIMKSLLGFNRKLENIAKTKNNPFTKSKYLDLATMLATIRPMLAEEGLYVMQHMVNDSNDSKTFAMDTYLIHESGEVLEIPGAFSKPDAITVQGLGAYETYKRRYSLMSALGIVGANDDTDGELDKPKQNKQSVDTHEPTDTKSSGGRLRL